MESIKTSEIGKVFMTCKINTEYTWENVYPQHIIAFIYAGELEITYGKSTINFVEGDTILVPKNQLSRSIKKPINGQPFKCLSMAIPDKQLREFYENRPVLETWSENSLKERPIKSHLLLKGYFNSLLPYFEMQDELPEPIVSIKILEALTIIDSIDKRASAVLGTFSKIGKIDLKKYMEEHYMYNLPLEKFATLTGRSLTSFKADFKKVFNKTPGKWLTEKRLNLAHYKLNSEKQKSSDVYLSVGFENLSHFSFAFKKAFGYNPSTLTNNQNLIR